MEWSVLVPQASVIGGFATGFAAAFAFAALFPAVMQMRSSAKLSRESVAVEGYREYLRVCFENPEYASYALAMKQLPSGTVKGIIGQLTPESEKYLWFASLMLNVCEQVLLNVPNSSEWRIGLMRQIQWHEGLFAEVWPSWSSEYSPEIDELVREALGWP